MATFAAASQALDYQIVDVFTETALKGNGLAVVFDTVGLPLSACRPSRASSIFPKRHSSSVAIIETEEREGVRVRIFTTQEELPFAGHPTLGTASVLKLSAPGSVAGRHVALALNVGRFPFASSPTASSAR